MRMQPYTDPQTPVLLPWPNWPPTAQSENPDTNKLIEALTNTQPLTDPRKEDKGKKKKGLKVGGSIGKNRKFWTL